MVCHGLLLCGNVYLADKQILLDGYSRHYSPPGGGIPIPRHTPSSPWRDWAEGNRHPSYDYHQQARPPPNAESSPHRPFRQPPPPYDGISAHYDRPRFGGRETNSSHRGDGTVTDECDLDECKSDEDTDDDNDSNCEVGIEAERLRDLDAKMQKLKEDRRGADEELKRTEIQRLADEEERKKKEAKERRDEVRRKEDVRKTEVEAAEIRDVEEAKKKIEDAATKVDEARRKVEEWRRKEAEAKRRLAESKRDTEKAKQMHLEAQRVAEDLKKDMEMKERENILRQRQVELIRRELDNLRREEEANKKEEAARLEEARKWKLQAEQAEFRKRAEEIRRTRGERKRNDDGAQSSSSRNPPGTSPGMSSTPQFNDGPFIRGTSPTIRPTASSLAVNRSASTSTDKSTTGYVSSGTYSMSSSPHSAPFSLLKSPQKHVDSQHCRTSEKLEAERLKSTGRLLSREEFQWVFEYHGRLWSRLKTLDELSWDDFPWPMARQPSNPDDMSLSLIGAYIQSPLYPDKSRTPKDRIKDHIRRWHPDSFEAKLLRKVVENEKEKVKLGAGYVTRYLNNLLEKENDNIFHD
jgi:hypothetical protein